MVALINGSLTAGAQINVGAAPGNCSNPVGIAQQPNGKVYVACQGSSNVAVINNVDSTVVASIPLGAAPTYAVPSSDGRFIFVAAGSGVAVLDATAATLVTSTAVAGTPD